MVKTVYMLVVVAAAITPGSGRALESQKAVAEPQKPGSEQKKPDAASKPPVPKLAAPMEVKPTAEKAAAPSIDANRSTLPTNGSRVSRSASWIVTFASSASYVPQS